MKPGDSHRKRMLKSFEDNKNLCVCKPLENYLQKTASIKYGKANLLIATI